MARGDEGAILTVSSVPLGRLVAVALCALVLAACSIAPRDPILGLWEFRAGSSDHQVIRFEPELRITLWIEPARVAGTSACNTYEGGLAFEGGGFGVSDLNASGLACPGDWATSEAEYLEALTRVDRARVTGDDLTLTGTAVELAFVRLGSTPIRDLADRVWVLDGLVEGAHTNFVAGAPATLVLKADGTLAGSTGCRSFAGTHRVVGDEIAVSNLSAQGVCRRELEPQDRHVLAAVGGTFIAHAEGGALFVFAANQLGLRYHAAAGE